jgi:hypothetical protein
VLKQQLGDRRIDWREFIRYSPLLGAHGFHIYPTHYSFGDHLATGD